MPGGGLGLGGRRVEGGVGRGRHFPVDLVSQGVQSLGGGDALLQEPAREGHEGVAPGVLSRSAATR